eukprot:133056_1
MSLSEKEITKCELLFMYGYIRALHKKTKLHIPDALRHLIFKFYPNIIQYDGIFITKNCGIHISIINKHEISGYFSAKLNKPLPIKMNESIIDNIKYKWKLQITGNIDRENWYFIGVVSNRCTNFSTWNRINSTHMSGSLTDAYGITLLENNVSLGKYCKTQQINQIIIVQYSVGMNECKLEIYVEKCNELKQLIDMINLPKIDGITHWFPVFSKPNNNTKITVIHSNDIIKM